MDESRAPRALSTSEGQVLIQGARGSGRRFIARSIHGRSERRQKPFLSHNCRDCSPLEDRRTFLGEIHEITPGRYLKYLGLLEEMREGTLYLEEVECLSLDMQRILCRVIEDERFSPIGHTQALAYRGRLIASTCFDLQELVNEGSFCRELFELLSGHIVRVETGD
ncbi:MAG: sigma 54-interacting transcriptional regulator [Planctomycetota bacterium]